MNLETKANMPRLFSFLDCLQDETSPQTLQIGLRDLGQKKTSKMSRIVIAANKKPMK